MRNLAMSSFLGTVVIVALVVAFFYTLMNKWGVWEYLQVHADAWTSKITHKDSDLFNQLFSCVFCTTWWTSVIVCLVLAICIRDWAILLVPFCSTPISRYLV